MKPDMRTVLVVTAMLLAPPALAQRDRDDRTDRAADEIEDAADRTADRLRDASDRAADREEEASGEQVPQNVLSFAPVSLLLSSVFLEYERALSPNLAVHFAPTFQWPTTTDRGITLRMLVLGAGVGASYFLFGGAPEGLWVGPQLSLDYFWGDAEIAGSTARIPVNVLQFGGQAMLGYTWMFGASKNFVLSAGGGVAARLANLTVAGGAGRESTTRVLPAVRINVGYAF